MRQPTFQTVRLGKGRHSSPDEGVCVMELASMLAGENFTDRPRSVSAPIAAFLRLYNDTIDNQRRQDLYSYAARVVGTAGSRELEDMRCRRLLEWTDERLSRWSLAYRIGRPRGGRAGLDDVEDVARYALRAVRRLSSETHAAVLALVDELIALGDRTDRRGEETVALSDAADGARRVFPDVHRV